jgi:hypothetical protein
MKKSQKNTNKAKIRENMWRKSQKKHEKYHKKTQKP